MANQTMEDNGQLGMESEARPKVSDKLWKFYKLLFVSSLVMSLLWMLWETYRRDNLGFDTKTFWDWMELMLVPAALAAAGLWFSRVQRQTELRIAREQKEEDSRIAIDRQRQNTLDRYFDQIAELILDRGLGQEADHSERRLATTRTLLVLRELDARRNRLVIRFLRDEGLVSGSGDEDIIQLAGVDLNEADLEGVDLAEFDLREVSLENASLEHADWRGANLAEAKLRNSNLRYVRLRGANLTGADMRGARLWGTDMKAAVLRGVNLAGAQLPEVNAEYIEAAWLRYKAGPQPSGLTGLVVRAGWMLVKAGELELVGASQPVLIFMFAGKLAQATVLEGANMPDGTKLQGPDNPDGPTFEEWAVRATPSRKKRRSGQ